MQLDRRAVTLLTVSLTLFVASIALPALAVTERPLFGGGAHDKLLSGFACLVMGWIVLPGWIANPLFVAAALTHGLRRHTAAIVLLVLALTSAVIGPVILANMKADLIELRYPHVGYYVWVGSMIVLLAGAIREKRRTAFPW